MLPFAFTATSADDVHAMPPTMRGANAPELRTGTGKACDLVSTGELLGLVGWSLSLLRTTANFCHKPADFFPLPGDAIGLLELLQLNMLRLRRGGDCFVAATAVAALELSSELS